MDRTLAVVILMGSLFVCTTAVLITALVLAYKERARGSDQQ